MPKNEVTKVRQDEKERLFLDGKLKIIANTIFEYKLFKNGKRLAAICADDKNDIFVVFIHTNKNEMDKATLMPKPRPGFAMHLLGRYDDQEMRVGYVGTDNKCYILFSFSLKTRGPIKKEAYDVILEQFDLPQNPA